MGSLRVWLLASLRVWLFRILVLAGAGVLLYSWFQPWWQAYVVELQQIAIIIHPWALESFVPPDYAFMLVGSEMPVWYAPFIWIYLGLCIAALLYSLFASEKRVGLGRFRLSLPKVLIMGVGLSFIVIVAAAVIVISIRGQDFWHAPLIGRIHIAFEEFEHSYVETSLLFGYWLACGVGPFLIILALLRNKIMGKPKLIA
jgi:hypothetical protein